MRCRFSRDDGSVTAEFATAMPAVLLVLAFAIGAIGLGAEQLRLQGATFEAARMLGRGDTGALASIHTVSASASATVSTYESGISICVRARVPVALGALSGITLSATACALDDAQS